MSQVSSSAHVLLRTSPHLREAPSVDVIMRNVAYALFPVCAFSIYQFGLSAAALILVTTLACLATEHAICRLAGKPSTLRDWSAAVTGILLALTLPPGLPLWMAAVAGIFGVAVGKMFFGGLGFNVMNPALVGRAFVQAAFTVPMTTWVPHSAPGRFTEFIPSTLTLPFLKAAPIADWLAQRAPDAFSGATPLAIMKFEGVPTDSVDLLLGSMAGSAGETSALLILLCGLYLVYRNMMNWRIPVAVLGTAALFSAIFHGINPEVYPGALFTMCSGGLMLGAVFMATDMVASPVTPRGVWIYGAVIGLVTVIIRFWGGLNEGIMYAILIGNACSPIISRLTQPRRYGAPKETQKKEEKSA